MKIENITMLVTSKTYPTISSRYNETVCIAGITKNGLWRRLYPICYRSLPKSEKFSKYQWIAFDAIRDLRDPRSESYKLVGKINPLEIITTKQQWAERRKDVLLNVKFDLQQIINTAYDSRKWESLFIFKPAEIIQFNVMDCSSDEKINKKKKFCFIRLI